HYVFQKLDLLPEGYSLPVGRTKPLGTAQAILAAKDVVGNASFAMINSDDFYGRDAFEVAASFLRSLPKDSKDVYANVGYKAANTMTENGSVKRGVLVFDDNAHLTELIESKLEHVDGKILATPLEGGEKRFLSPDSLVSMNLFCFTHEIMDYIEEGFPRFMEENKDHLDSAEYLLPTLVSETMERQGTTVKVLGTSAVWHGVTYREDKPDVVASIARLVEEGEYPKNLW
ncbi:MAG: sugar phosphate nucleotidyltransferase, partial [Candidatus Enteromonas sp.]